MRQLIRHMNLFLCILGLAAAGCGRAAAQTSPSKTIRIATFNVSLSRPAAGQLIADLKAFDRQASKIAHIIQVIRPDILLLNEFDYDTLHQSVWAFQERYLAISQIGIRSIRYPYHYTAPVNTGVLIGRDINGDGRTDGPEDAFGYGRFPGQYGMVIFSKYPIRTEQIRTFQNFLWKDMPLSMLPIRVYDKQTQEIMRLSSKSHWDITIECPGGIIHFLCSHPTPPVFDGPRDPNGKRNHDEIRFWADYITPGNSDYIYDDKGKKGGLQANFRFVILGDLNADPYDGDSTASAAKQILRCSNVQDPQPSSTGSAQYAAALPQFNASHLGQPELDTYQSPPDKAPGNLRLDYVLPSTGIKVIQSGVFWPGPNSPDAPLNDASDHHLVYVDIQL